jgi:Arc/MetJ-type ribon-helix-helix transcriptional regulator
MCEKSNENGCHGQHEEVGKKLREEILGHIKIEGLKDLNSIGREIREFIKTTVASGRVNVLMVRVEDETLKSIDALVESELFRSRSEAAAFLIAKGLDATSELFKKVMEKTSEIERLRGEIRDILGVKKEEAPEKVEPSPSPAAE